MADEGATVESNTQVGAATGSTLFGNIVGGIQGDESWGDFVTPGGTGSQIADPLDLFGFQAGKDAGDAAKAQAEAAMKAQKFLQDQYKTLVGLQSPFIQGGTQAFGMQAALTGLQGPEAQQQAMQQFQQAQQGAVNFGMQGTGWNGMPNVQGAIGDYAQNVAGMDYDNYYNRLGGIAGMGQSSASALGGVTVDQNQGIAAAMQAGGDARTNNALMQSQIRAQSASNLGNLGGAVLGGMGNTSQASKVSGYSPNIQNPAGQGGINNLDTYKWGM